MLIGGWGLALFRWSDGHFGLIDKSKISNRLAVTTNVVIAVMFLGDKYLFHLNQNNLSKGTITSTPFSISTTTNPDELRVVN